MINVLQFWFGGAKNVVAVAVEVTIIFIMLVDVVILVVELAIA
jgi:hypothetical protein